MRVLRVLGEGLPRFCITLKCISFWSIEWTVMAVIFVARNFAMIVEIDLRAKWSDILIKRDCSPFLSFFLSLEVMNCPKLGARAFHFLFRDPSRFAVEGGSERGRREGREGRPTAKV